MSNYISEILLAPSDAEVRFIAGGGVAAVLHGVERSTLDVDVAGLEKLLAIKRTISPLRNKDLIDIIS